MTILIILLVLLALPAFYGIRLLVKETQRKEKQKKLAAAYQRLLLQHKLIPERYEIMRDRAIALDRKNKMLAVVDLRNANPLQCCIPLRTIGETKLVKKRDPKGAIQTIELQLMPKQDGTIYCICFFDAAFDTVTELPHLTNQALIWQMHVNLHKRPGMVSLEQEYVL